MSQTIRIVIAALGGEGGGVLGKWIAKLASDQGYVSQVTSVPGVAQRTGATIYYLELFPRAEMDAAGQLPVMSMFPTPGDVDVVICSEIIEAGRMVQRGFVTPDRTTLVTSTHRTFGITEKEALGNGMADSAAISEICASHAKSFISFDMLEVARKHDSVINAALFGALAETGCLPFAKQAFVDVIVAGKIAIESNCKAFEASYQLAAEQQTPVQVSAVQLSSEQPETAQVVKIVEAVAAPAEAPLALPTFTSPRGQALMQRIAPFPEAAQALMALGVQKLNHYQDADYAAFYLDRLEQLRAVADDGELLANTARFLALWMAYEDVYRVAQIKTSAARVARFRDEVKADEGQSVAIVEFLHPRIEEFCGAMPAGLGRWAERNSASRWLLKKMSKPRNVTTNSLLGFTTFYVMAKLRRIRRSTLQYQHEQAFIQRWLDAVTQLAAKDVAAAAALAQCGQLVKGYGKTRERGFANLDKILNQVASGGLIASRRIDSLRRSALADDGGKALAAELKAA